MRANPSLASENNSSRNDDFKLIHGIGRGIENRLHAAGILTYADLAALTPEGVAVLLSKLVGITVKRVVDQDWIGQASKLVPVEVTNDSESSGSRQHYASFTVELLLDETNEVRRTRVMYIQGKTEDSWAGWDEAQLVQFFLRQVIIHLPEPEPIPINIEPQELALQPPQVVRTPPLHPSPKRLTGDPRLRNIVITSPETGGRSRVKAKGQPFGVDLTLDFNEVLPPSIKLLAYSVHILAKEIGSGIYQPISQAQGTFELTDAVAINMQSTGLPEGTYRISVDLALSTLSADPAILPELTAQLDGGFLHIY